MDFWGYLFIFYFNLFYYYLLGECILTVRHILVECNHFAQERKDIFGRRDVVESLRYYTTRMSCLRFHPTLILLFLNQTEFYYKF